MDALRRKARSAGGDLFGDFVRFAGAGALIGAAALIGLGAIAEGLGILLLLPLLGTLLEGGVVAGAAVDWMPGWLRTFDATGRLLILLALFVVLMAARAVVLTVRESYLARLQHGFVESIRLQLIERVAAGPWQTIAGVQNARIIHALNTDMQQIGLAAHYILQCSVAVVLLAAQCAIAFLLSPAAAAIALSLLSVLAVVARRSLRRAHHLGASLSGQYLAMTEGSIRLLNGLKTAAAQNLQGRFVEHYGAASSAAVSHRVEFVRMQATLLNSTTTVAALIGALTVLIGTTLLGVHPAVLVTLLLVLSRMQSPALLLLQGSQHIVHSLPAYRMVQALKRMLPRAQREPETKSIAPAGAQPPCSLSLRRVTFIHEGEEGATSAGLHEVGFSIPAGAVVGIAGPSGAGKTTCVDLLAGLLTPHAGQVLVDGEVLEGDALRRHRVRLAYVSQDPLLFADSVRRNLAWAAPAASDAAMWRALALAGADNLVRRLGYGLESMVGERGGFLSAGERQRLALARAFLRRPSLLILDEATTSIDIASERAILERLNGLDRRPTILLVSHRAESLALCTRILDFSEGRLVGDRQCAKHPRARGGRIRPQPGTKGTVA